MAIFRAQFCIKCININKFLLITKLTLQFTLNINHNKNQSNNSSALSVPTKILVCQHVPRKAKLKMNQRVPNKNADLLKKISLMGTEVLCRID